MWAAREVTLKDLLAGLLIKTQLGGGLCGSHHLSNERNSP